MNLYQAFKSAAFLLDAERAHHLTMKAASFSPQLARIFDNFDQHQKYHFSRNNLRWNFPLGLAAGFDKNAQAIPFFEKLGFGAVEVGTITHKPQTGNPKPRIFRYPEKEAIRNAMGFPNDGADKIFKRLKKLDSHKICVGANLGKNKTTSIEDTPKEYARLYEKFAPVSDYLVINISSPNTPGLRAFQNKEQLTPLLLAVKEKHEIFPKPLFLKISPDMEREEIKAICEVSKELKLSGIIATNTSVAHDLGVGGISGKPIKELSMNARKTVCEVMREDSSQTIIGVGGVDSYADLKKFWKQGGHFMQVYTSFIYKGPSLLLEIQKGIDKDLRKHNFKNLTEMLSNSEVL